MCMCSSVHVCQMDVQVTPLGSVRCGVSATTQKGAASLQVRESCCIILGSAASISAHALHPCHHPTTLPAPPNSTKNSPHVRCQPAAAGARLATPLLM